MNELQITVNVDQGFINTNVEELKTQLEEKMRDFTTEVFTEDSKAIAKAELASLRKLREAIETRRKDVKEQCMLPYKEFEKEVKELVAIVDKPIAFIDGQLKEMEEKRIREKKILISELYLKCVGDLQDFLPLDRIYDKKWENAGTKPKKIEEEINKLVGKTVLDIEIIKNSISDVKEDALELYRRCGDLSKALTYINDYETNKKRAMEIEAEKRRKEEERLRVVELERARADERKKLHEIEQAKEQAVRKVEESEGFFESDTLPFEQPNTVTVFYRVVATKEELEKIENVFNSFGIFFERREA